MHDRRVGLRCVSTLTSPSLTCNIFSSIKQGKVKQRIMTKYAFYLPGGTFPLVNREWK